MGCLEGSQPDKSSKTEGKKDEAQPVNTVRTIQFPQIIPFIAKERDQELKSVNHLHY